MSGRSTIELKAKEIGIDLDAGIIGEVVETLKELEYEGYHFEAADASLELLIRSATGWTQDQFEIDSFSVSVGHKKGSGARAWNDVAVEVDTQATVTATVGEEKITAEGVGNGPVNALDSALRKALRGEFPHIDSFNLTDYKVRVLESGRGTGAVTRVLLDTTDGEQTWTTIGVSTNIIEASWQALVDSLVYGLLHSES
jgi:2-isopropylmalate synthase